MKENCDYGLKNGALIQFFGTNEMYTNANLTNEAAERYLKEFPQAIGLFSNYPKDWEERANKDIETILELDDTLVAELSLKLSGGATKKSLKEEYKAYQLSGKVLTARLLDAYLKAASECKPNENTQEGKGE